MVSPANVVKVERFSLRETSTMHQFYVFSPYFWPCFSEEYRDFLDIMVTLS